MRGGGAARLHGLQQLRRPVRLLLLLLPLAAVLRPRRHGPRPRSRAHAHTLVGWPTGASVPAAGPGNVRPGSFACCDARRTVRDGDMIWRAAVDNKLIAGGGECSVSKNTAALCSPPLRRRAVATAASDSRCRGPTYCLQRRGGLSLAGWMRFHRILPSKMK